MAKLYDTKYKQMSFEISNHFDIIYNQEKKDDVEGKKKLSNFVKSYIVKAFDLAEGSHDNMTKDKFAKMEFYEPKDLSVETLKKRFQNTSTNLNMKETGGFTKFLDHLAGIFKNKSKVYDIEGMI